MPGACETHRTLSAATTNSTLVRTGSRKLHGYYFSNTNAAARYLKFYDLAAAPTVGTDTPKLTLLLPAGQAGHISFDESIAFSKGMGFGITTGVADNDTGAVAANEQVINLFYT